MAVLSFETTPKIWDFAASWLVLTEAGGVIETFDGSQPFPIRGGQDYTSQDYPLLAAATSDLAHKARNWLQIKSEPTHIIVGKRTEK